MGRLVTKTITQRTIDYTDTLWEYYKDVGEIFEWDEKKDGESQYGIRVIQTQRSGYITPVEEYIGHLNKKQGEGRPEMGHDGDMPEYTSLYT